MSKSCTKDKIQWAASKIGVCFREDAKGIVIERNGAIAGVAVYDTFSPVDCCMHVASDGSSRWMTRRFLVEAFYYPFVRLGLRRVTALVASKNLAALRFDLHLGFEEEGLCREGMPDDDLVILGMLKRNCRFIPPERRLQ